MKSLSASILLAVAFLAGTSFAHASDKKPKPPKAPKASKALAKALDGNYAYVPSGYMKLTETDSLSVQAFFMRKGEVTNGEYREFLADLKAKGETEKLAIAQIDSAKWSLRQGYYQPMGDFYGWHPAYANYPVVNITYEAAQLYCEWLSEKVRKETGMENLVFRLPTREEFLRAARGNSLRPYAWEGPFIRNHTGAYLCNHVHFGSESVHYNPETKEYEVINVYDKFVAASLDDNAMITAPSESFWPNEFDLYNLNGNVSEMVSEKGTVVGGDWYSTGYDVRNESVKTINEASPMVGFRPVVTFLAN